MNPDTILHADLLDIIFENRNKDYGAYILRREYNNTLLKGLLAMFALVLMIALWQILKVDTHKNIITVIMDKTRTLEEQPLMRKKQDPIKPRVLPQTTTAVPNRNPLIVPTNIVTTPPPTVEQIQTSGIGKPMEGEPVASTTNVSGGNEHGNNPANNIVPVKPEADKSTPTSSPDVMPQYPGGINELIKFLKKNLKAPADLEENEEIAVKVRFVVNYDGSLAGFTVEQSGGMVFDNEVIRVLKRMPKWIPGKTSGENVSVYFIIPVKFNAVQY